jgi:hypothetical protein
MAGILVDAAGRIAGCGVAVIVPQRGQISSSTFFQTLNLALALAPGKNLSQSQSKIKN